MWSLAWPWMLLALPLPLLVRAILSPVTESQEAGLKVPSFKGFAVVTDRARSEQLMNWRVWVAITAWTLLVLAAARPERVGDEIDVPVSGRNLMLAVDLSGSMDAKDFALGNRRVDRLTATKAVASDFIERRKGDRIGLILFGERAYLQVPLTLDRETVNILLMESEIGLAGEKTAIGDAITLAVKRIYDQGAQGDEQVLVLLTDGANTAGEINPVKAAELAQQIGLRIYTIGIGADAEIETTWFGLRRTNPAAQLDEKSLREIARLSGGRYFRARDSQQLAQIYQLLNELEPLPRDERQLRPIIALFVWPLATALGLALLLILAPAWRRI